MKITPSLELVLQLAAQEAVAAAFTEIEPEHLLMGLLKFGGLPVRNLQAGPDGPAPLQQLIDEIETLLDRLRRRNIDSTPLRRQLRRRLGRGGADAAQRELRRSPASRKLFDDAAASAYEDGADGVAAVHLLDAILSSPTPLIRDLVNSTADKPKQKSGDQDQLLRRGRDLVQLAADGRLPAANDRQAEARALRRVLGGPPAKSVLGVCGSIEGAVACVHALARELRSEAKDSPLADKRLIDLDELLSGGDPAGEILERLRNVLSEAAESADVIVALRLWEDGKLPPGDVWPIVESALAETNLQLIVLATPGVYNQMAAGDRRRLRRVHVMWLRNETVQEIPKVI